MPCVFIQFGLATFVFTVSEIKNKVANSGLLTLSLKDFMPENIEAFDLKPFLFMELILKEKDYRAALKAFDFSIYQNKLVAIHCSADAIIPHWAYMLATTYIQPFAKEIFFGSPMEFTKHQLVANIQQVDVLPYTDKRMVIKGCGEENIDAAAYIAITKILLPVAKSILYGEPCSTVPIYKKPKL